VAAIAGDADIAQVAAAIADPARARILLALSDGRALPASSLAAAAGVAASTASEHLRRLVESGLVTVRPQGRHRYFRLAGSEVGAVLEALSRLAPPVTVRTLKQGTRAAALRRARTCYDHRAGELGVAIFAQLVDMGAVEGTGDEDAGYRLTPDGRVLLERVGVALPAPAADGSMQLRYCVDWTERRHHLSGAAGRAVAARLFELGWIERAGTSRAVRVTDDGLRGLRHRLGLLLS
jgi:DNA-binding transcriptional ArsR family regulator